MPSESSVANAMASRFRMKLVMSSPPSPSCHISLSALRTSFGLGRNTVGEKIQMKNRSTNWKPTIQRTVCLEITLLGEKTSIAFIWGSFKPGHFEPTPCHFERSEKSAFPSPQANSRFLVAFAPRNDKIRRCTLATRQCDLHAAVGRFPGGRVVGRHRTLRTVPYDLEAVIGEVARRVLLQPILYRGSAGVGERLIHSLAARVVGVTIDLNEEAGDSQRVLQFRHGAHAFRGERCLAGVEINRV